MIVTAVRCRGTGAACLLNSLIVATARNSPATGSSPCLATCSANPPPLERPARTTGRPESPVRCPARAARKAASSSRGSPGGGRAMCHTPFHPSGNTAVTPAAGALVASPVNVAVSLPVIPDPCSTMSSGTPASCGPRASL
jgi:hypothetical protein